MPLDLQILGSGVYTPREAGRLIGVKQRDVLRWTRGSGASEPLWRSYYLPLDNSTEISFLDMLEIRVVAALRGAGVSLQAIRFAIDFAQREYNIDRPLTSKRFRTDGKEILIEALEEDGDLTSLSRKRAGQKVFKIIVEQSLRDLDYDDERPIRWRPRKSRFVVIDPARSFGDPILDEFGISTHVIREEFNAFGDIRYLSRIYEIPDAQIKSAVNFERALDGQGTV